MSIHQDGNSDSLVWGIGPSPCKALILGEAPGEQEEIEGEPFVGASGILLNLALQSAGISREQVYITNAYKLRPENNRTPTEAELRSHEEYLYDEFELVRPEYILTLGNVAQGVMTHLFYGITQTRGKWLSASQVDDVWSANVLPTYHPSYVLRQGGLESHACGEFFADVVKFVEDAFR